jgi:hypothetical protein
MEITPFHIIGLSLPTLTLFYALSTPAVGGPHLHRELFGDGNVEFEARFEINPDGILLRSDPKGLRFEGRWQEGDEEREVTGVRYLREGRPHYVITLADGAIEAEIVPGKKHCPGELRYRARKKEAPPSEGTLASGPCYGA